MKSLVNSASIGISCLSRSVVSALLKVSGYFRPDTYMNRSIFSGVRPRPPVSIITPLLLLMLMRRRLGATRFLLSLIFWREEGSLVRYSLFFPFLAMKRAESPSGLSRVPKKTKRTLDFITW